MALWVKECVAGGQDLVGVTEVELGKLVHVYLPGWVSAGALNSRQPCRRRHQAWWGVGASLEVQD